MDKTSEESIKRKLAEQIEAYCKKLKEYAQINNVDLSRILITNKPR